ncbi:MAG: phosphoribosylglycinamide synthetase C domain-containing protein [Oscillospiraceae bacterium]
MTAGGRVAGVTAAAATLPEAVREAYAACRRGRICRNSYCRKDIGGQALAAWRD